MSDEMINVGGADVGLLQVAGINLDDVEAVRYSRTPAGFFVFKIAEAKLGVVGKDDKKAFAAQFKFEIMNVISLVDESIDAAKWVGKSHSENFRIAGESMLEDIGRIKAFFQDSGFRASGTLEELIAQSVGHVFQGQIRHQKDRNDPETIYANLNRDPKTLKPFEAEAA